jgi:hypothetical protein
LFSSGLILKGGGAIVPPLYFKLVDFDPFRKE